MKRYVLGFIFNNNLTKTLLILKKRGPQVDRWNGIGGEAHDDETYLDAMKREAREETGLDIVTWDSPVQGHWERFSTLSGVDYQIACFYAVLSDDEFDSFSSPTDEKVMVWSVYPIVLAGTLPLVRGVTWLIEMARAHARGDDHNEYEVCRR